VKRLLIILSLAAIVGLPFLLRPKQAAVERADDVVVIVTPHNEAIRHEYAIGFKAWYYARTGRTVAIDWRVLGGTTEIARYLEGVYDQAFQNYWTGTLKQRWNLEIESTFQSRKLPAGSSPIVQTARAAFFASSVSSGIDVFFGGGAPDFEQQADAGHFWDSGLLRRHPEWFTDQVIPRLFGGEMFWRSDGLWFGSVISSYGIIYNRDALTRLGFVGVPIQWADLGDPRFYGEIALCDPTKSGSITMAFENVIQQQMQQKLPATGSDRAAVREGWMSGLRLIQRIGANARYFTDTSQKPPIDVADGNCAAGLCIDFYGNQQAEAVLRRADSTRLGFASPPGGTAYSVDPIALLRGAPNRKPAELFVEYSLSLAGQKLWGFKPGVPGGPRDFALRRAPIRRDYYSNPAWKPLRSDPNFDPYAASERLIYRPQWTGPLFREMAFIIRVMCEDTHVELTAAWRAVQAAPEPARSHALAVLQDISFVSYDHAMTDIKQALASRDKAQEIVLTDTLAKRFRLQYAAALAAASGR